MYLINKLQGNGQTSLSSTLSVNTAPMTHNANLQQFFPQQDDTRTSPTLTSRTFASISLEDPLDDMGMLNKRLNEWIENGGLPNERDERQLAARGWKLSYEIGTELFAPRGKSFTSLPEIFDLPGFVNNLTTVKIDYNSLTHLPKTFAGLVNLKALYVDNNKLESLPDFFGNFPRLETLNVKNNPQLSSLPKSLGTCTLLKKIDANGSISSDAVAQILASSRAAREAKV